MEWGNFWSSHLPRTSYDIDLDGDSPNPNDQVQFNYLPLSLRCSSEQIKILRLLFQGFEKMISGMYLGDIVRRVILRMSQESDIFGPVSSRLSMPFILRYVSVDHCALFLYLLVLFYIPIIKILGKLWSSTLINPWKSN